MRGFGIDANFSQAIVIVTRPLRARAGPPWRAREAHVAATARPEQRRRAPHNLIAGLTISDGAQGYPKVLLTAETARKE
jgi:hypothetical protein